MAGSLSDYSGRRSLTFEALVKLMRRIASGLQGGARARNYSSRRISRQYHLPLEM